MQKIHKDEIMIATIEEKEHFLTALEIEFQRENSIFIRPEDGCFLSNNKFDPETFLNETKIFVKIIGKNKYFHFYLTEDKDEFIKIRVSKSKGTRIWFNRQHSDIDFTIYSPEIDFTRNYSKINRLTYIENVKSSEIRKTLYKLIESEYYSRRESIFRSSTDGYFEKSPLDIKDLLESIEIRKSKYDSGETLYSFFLTRGKFQGKKYKISVKEDVNTFTVFYYGKSIIYSKIKNKTGRFLLPFKIDKEIYKTQKALDLSSLISRFPKIQTNSKLFELTNSEFFFFGDGNVELGENKVKVNCSIAYIGIKLLNGNFSFALVTYNEHNFLTFQLLKRDEMVKLNPQIDFNLADEHFFKYVDL